MIDPEAVRAALRPDTVLVSVMFANNEIGVLQDIAAIGAICRERGVPLHTDAAQAVGKIPMSVRELPIDLLSLTAHKIYGPKGVGALYVSNRVRPLLQPINFGGGQERGLRPGTLATHQIAGLGAACALAKELQPAEALRLASLRERLWGGLRDLEGVYLNGEGAPRLPGILNVSFAGVEGESLVAGLTEVAVSTGSACNSATAEPSYVLRALGRGTQLAQSSLRFSLGRLTTVADVDVAIRAVRREIERLRALSPDGGQIPGGIAGLPPGAGAFPAGVGPIFSGEAGRAGEETWVRFHLLVGDGAVKEARFQAYGCPHTVSVASWLASSLPGRRRENLLPGTPPDWARERGVPAEKLGRLLVLEDALKACLRHWAAGE
jgi:Aminotransferase class-V